MSSPFMAVTFPSVTMRTTREFWQFGSWIMARLGTRHQGAVWVIAAVSKDLLGDFKPGFFGRRYHFGSGQTQKNGFRSRRLNSGCDGFS